MKQIDINTWKRKEHFNFFINTAYPIYNITFNLDVTNLKRFITDHKISFNLSMIYISTKAINSIENFKYRLHDKEVVLYDELNPSYAEIEVDSDLFKMITVPMESDLFTFVQNAKEKGIKQMEYFVIQDFIGHDDLIFYSSLPWISFTSIDHTINLKKEDAIQRVSFGKYFTENNKILMPYNIQVNHLFVDGIHLGMLKDNMDEIIQQL